MSRVPEPLFDVNLTQEQVFRMCREHHIRPQHYRCYWRFVARSEILSRDFGNRIVWLSNYKGLIDRLLAIIDGAA
jgi:hypothetical protein